MKEMKKRMPGDEGEKLAGKGGDDDEDDEGGRKPPELKEGQQEPGPTKTAGQMLLTSGGSRRARLLDMLKLDANRKLPLGMGDTGKPSERKRPGLVNAL